MCDTKKKHKLKSPIKVKIWAFGKEFRQNPTTNKWFYKMERLSSYFEVCLNVWNTKDPVQHAGLTILFTAPSQATIKGEFVSCLFENQLHANISN